MSDRLIFTLWLTLCLGLWGSIARDPITIIFCTGATVPFTVLLIREFRDRRATRGS